ncbi:hypothetical protein DOY81_014049 [Sarcophaga bullata]|nr:hypothetical protein DOY81_014049 [Sarcophaga bullata]
MPTTSATPTHRTQMPMLLILFFELPMFEDKVVQMYETMMTRHSTMIVGPTGGGKTVVINTLIKAQTFMGLPTKCITLNPKACSVIELYGYLDPDTRDWVDGLFSNIFRELNKPIERDLNKSTEHTTTQHNTTQHNTP